MGQTLGAPPLLGGGLGPHLTQSPWAEAYLHAKWHLGASSHLATIEMDRKFGGRSARLFGEGDESPFNKSRLGGGLLPY